MARRDDIQGLRAVAVLLVALGHAGVPFLGGGYVGVDVFFVLSGFLITGLLLAEAERGGTVSLGDFYARRAPRDALARPPRPLRLDDPAPAARPLVGGARRRELGREAHAGSARVGALTTRPHSRTSC